MKNFVAIFMSFVMALPIFAAAPPQPTSVTLMVNKTTGAITAPVDAATFASANNLGGGGGSQNVFTSIVVAGQTTITANSTTTPVTFATANNSTMTIITSNTTPKTVTFNVIAGSGSGNVTHTGALAGNNSVWGNGGGDIVTDAIMTKNATTVTVTGNLAVTGNQSANNTNTDNLTITTGVNWGSTIMPGANGGTGVANTGHLITVGSNFTMSGAHDITLSIPANVTLTSPDISASLGFRGIPWVVHNSNATTTTNDNGKGWIGDGIGNNTTTYTINRTQASTDAGNGGWAWTVFHGTVGNNVTVTASTGNIVLAGSGNLTGGTSAIIASGGIATFTLANATLIVSGSNVTVP